MTMSNPPVVLDTNIFPYKDIVHWLGSYRSDKIIPTVVYMELAVWYYAKGSDLGMLDAMLRSAAIEPREFDVQHAQTCAFFIKEHKIPKDRWKDPMIAAYAVTPPFILLTNNIRDFSPMLGKRAIPPYDFKKAIEAGNLYDFLDSDESDPE